MYDLSQLGKWGILLILLYRGWRLVLQWGLTLDILYQRLVLNIPFENLVKEITIVGGLVCLRTVEKRMKLTI